MNKKRPQRDTKDFNPYLLEIFMIAGFIGSGITTYKGAYEIFDHNVLVALFITLFFQGLMYVIARYLVKSRDRRHRRTVSLCIAWAALAAFSIYSSALAMYGLQQGSLKRDHQRTSIVSQWNETAKAIADFKTRAMSEINSAKQVKNLEITNERNRIRVARAARRPYSTETLQKLSAELNPITAAESKLQQISLLSVAAPDKSEDAERRITESLAAVNDAYASLPESTRPRVSLPRLPEAPQFPEHIQTAFWKELFSGSAPALTMLFFAMVLDLLPPFIRFGSSRRRTLDERILAFRHWKRRLRIATDAPLVAEIESVKITVEGVPALDIRINVPTAHGGPLLNIDRDFAEVTKEVSREKGCEMTLASVTSAQGNPIVDDRPLLDQLGEDRELILSYAPKPDSDFDTYSDKVN